MNTLEFYAPSSRIWQCLTWLVFSSFFKLFSRLTPGTQASWISPPPVSLLLWHTSPLATQLCVCLLCRPADGTPPSILDPPCPHSVQTPSGLTCPPSPRHLSRGKEGRKEDGREGGRPGCRGRRSAGRGCTGRSCWGQIWAWSLL